MYIQPDALVTIRERDQLRLITEITLRDFVQAMETSRTRKRKYANAQGSCAALHRKGVAC